jgi:hypothetical protein
MNAWIDCMTYVDDPSAGMSTIHCKPGSVIVVELRHAETFRKRCPELYDAVVDGIDVVNCRRLETGDPAVLAISSGF